MNIFFEERWSSNQELCFLQAHLRPYLDELLSYRTYLSKVVLGGAFG